jgi:hypothetical protein
MNVPIYKKLIIDLQLEWEELNKKMNIILEYEQRHKGVLKRFCPPVCYSDCNCTNSTPRISQSKNGMAREDPLLSHATVCDGIHGDYHSCITFDNLTEDNEVYVLLYYPIYSGWDFPEYPFLFVETKQGGMLVNLKIQTRWFRECMGTGKISTILKFCWSSYDE